MIFAAYINPKERTPIVQIPRKVLIIGNIANNGFLAGQALNKSGFDVDVLCDDYFHCMAYPEWESQYLLLEPSLQTKISREKLEIHSNVYKRPNWFAQGLRVDAVEYLIAKRKNLVTDSERLWIKLIDQSFPNQEHNSQEIASDSASRKYNILKFSFPKLWRIVVNLISRFFTRAVNVLGRKLFYSADRYSHLVDLLVPDIFLRPLIVKFYGKDICSRIEELCTHYDEVVLFGPSALWAYLIPNQEFSFLEHGTVRYASERSDLLSIVLHRVYLNSKAILITNGDIFSSPQLLPKATMIPTVHPIVWFEESPEELGDEFLLREWQPWDRIRNKKFLFSPVRQDWKVKGVNFYLQNLKIIVGEFPELEFVFTNWGADLDAAKEMVNSFHLIDRVHWIDTMSRPVLATIALKSTLVLDQMALPHFGSTAPQVLSLGVPVCSSYDPKSTKEIALEPAPILPVSNIEDLLLHIHNLSSENKRMEYSISAIKWIQKWHNEVRVVGDFKELFKAMKGDYV